MWIDSLWPYLSCVFILGCGPGLGDINIPISNGYSFSEAGGYEKAIIYTGNERRKEFVIDAAVINFALADEQLFVLRQPRETFTAEDGVLDSRLSNRCEYWIINVKSHEITGPMSQVELMAKLGGVGNPLARLTEPISAAVPSYCLREN